MEFVELVKKVKSNIAKAVVGKDDVVELLILTLLSGGHMLLEDVPGTGKTLLAKSLAQSIDCDFARVQFTPDLLPTDLTGVNYFDMQDSKFKFTKGPIFTNIMLADEINRATPKTQSGLLESMEEGQVSVEGKTYKLDEILMVIATQNPVDTIGTFSLPEAQTDRFMVHSQMKYPSHSEAVEIARLHGREKFTLSAVIKKEDIISARNQLNGVFIHSDCLSYAVSICESTRFHSEIMLGVSPRGVIHLLKIARGYALLCGRNYVLPDDIKKAAPHVLSHRLVLKSKFSAKQKDRAEIILEILKEVSVPSESIDFTK